MTHSDKIETYKVLMATRGVAAATAAPPLWELLWSLGLEIPPPLFMSAPMLFLLCGTAFGIVFASGVWIFRNLGPRGMPLSEAGWVALVAGAAFGLTLAWYCRRLARRQQLGSWSAFGDSPVSAHDNSFKPITLRGGNRPR